MTENKVVFTRRQKLLIILGFVCLSIFIGVISLPLLSLVLFLILDKFMPGDRTVYTLGVVIPLIWAPILGIIFGTILGITIASSKIKKYENK